ncbi:hypothetical protein [Laceyella putida]|uniref:Uncharacterized protein n=1 Tax=Laceyella putida TaxID=110101 RepID=A0ABW2RJ92_9BACL
MGSLFGHHPRSLRLKGVRTLPLRHWFPAWAIRNHPVKDANYSLNIQNLNGVIPLTVPAHQNESMPLSTQAWQSEEHQRWMAWLYAVFSRMKLHAFKETTAYHVQCADGTLIPLTRFIYGLADLRELKNLLPSTSGKLITLMGQVTRIRTTPTTHRITLSGDHPSDTCELILSRFLYSEAAIRPFHRRHIACCGFLHTQGTQFFMKIHSLPHQLTPISGNRFITLPHPQVQLAAIQQAFLQYTRHESIDYPLVQHDYVARWRSLVSDLNQEIRAISQRFPLLQKQLIVTEHEWRKQQAKYKASREKWLPAPSPSLWARLAQKGAEWGFYRSRKKARHERDQAFFRTFAREILSLSRKRRCLQEEMDHLARSIKAREAELAELSKLTWLEKDFSPHAEAILHRIPLSPHVTVIVATRFTVMEEQIHLRGELYLFKFHGKVPYPFAKLGGPSVRTTFAAFKSNLQCYWGKVNTLLQQFNATKQKNVL